MYISGNLIASQTNAHLSGRAFNNRSSQSLKVWKTLFVSVPYYLVEAVEEQVHTVRLTMGVGLVISGGCCLLLWQFAKTFTDLVQIPGNNELAHKSTRKGRKFNWFATFFVRFLFIGQVYFCLEH